LPKEHVSGNQTHSASLGNRVDLHYSRFRLFARANSVNNQWFTDSIRVQNRHFQTRIREDGLVGRDEHRQHRSLGDRQARNGAHAVCHITRTAPTVTAAGDERIEIVLPDGVPEQVLYDRMRTVFSRKDAEAGDIVFNHTLLEFARHYGYLPKACRPYQSVDKPASR
jgi:hypothetical protein